MSLKTILFSWDPFLEKALLPAAASLKTHFRITGAVEKDPEKIKNAKETFPAMKFYDTLESAAEAEKPEAVIISGGAEERHKTVLEALNSEMHVFCAGPAALKLLDFDVLMDKARGRKKALYSGAFAFGEPQLKSAGELLSSGMLGEIKSLYLALTSRLNEEIFTERLRWEALSTALSLNPSNPLSVSARSEKKDGGSELDLKINYLSSSAQIFIKKGAAFKSGVLNLLCENGALEIYDAFLKLKTGANLNKEMNFPSDFFSEDFHPLFVRKELEDFYNLALKGEAESNARKTALYLKTVSGAEKAAETNKTVPL